MDRYTLTALFETKKSSLDEWKNIRQSSNCFTKCIRIFQRQMIYILFPCYFIFAIVSISMGLIPYDLHRIIRGVFGSLGYFLSIWAFRYIFSAFVSKPIGRYIKETEGVVTGYTTWTSTSGGKGKGSTDYESFYLQFTVYHDFYYYDIQYHYRSPGKIFDNKSIPTKAIVFYYVESISNCFENDSYVYFQLPPNMDLEQRAVWGCFFMATAMFFSASAWTLSFFSNISFVGRPNSIVAGSLVFIGLLASGWYAKYNGRFDFRLKLYECVYNARPDIGGYCQELLSDFPKEVVNRIIIPYTENSSEESSDNKVLIHM